METLAKTVKRIPNVPLNLSSHELIEILDKYEFSDLDSVTQKEIIEHCIEQSDKNDCLKGR